MEAGERAHDRPRSAFGAIPTQSVIWAESGHAVGTNFPRSCGRPTSTADRGGNPVGREESEGQHFLSQEQRQHARRFYGGCVDVVEEIVQLSADPEIAPQADGLAAGLTCLLSLLPYTSVLHSLGPHTSTPGQFQCRHLISFTAPTSTPSATYSSSGSLRTKPHYLLSLGSLPQPASSPWPWTSTSPID
jgi:hypothetical protein